MTPAAIGVASIVAATVIWGVSPLYYAQLNHIPPFEVVVHRVLWSLPPIALYALWSGRREKLVALARDRRKLGVIALSAATVSVNWVLFIYAIQIGEAAQASFGYYIYPLAGLLIGFGVFGERVTGAQWASAAIAVAGVAWIGWRFDALPWLALTVAATFAAYGTIRKAANVGPMVGVTWELALMLPILIAYLLWIGGGRFFADSEDALLLIGGSVFTGLPLILFVEATKQLRFSTVGVLFYINPTLQFVSAMILGEPFGIDRAIGFGLIWIAVTIYCIELLRLDRARKSLA